MDTLWYKIKTTFIDQDRYLFFVEGLKTTLLLTFAAFLLGTAFGVLLCMAARSKSPAVRKAAGFVRTLILEIPTMVLLMILVYIIFGSSALGVIWVVTIGLTLKAGTYLSQIFGSALDTVQSGEMEAARTLGMSRWQAFRYVALPQTAAAALPLYRNQFIATMQETSVVGYLAVVDLTKAASIVASRTLDAFFGLITITVIYFLIGGVMKLVFRLILARQRKGGEPA